jgi:exodeoxyribonuclease V beta subunit
MQTFSALTIELGGRNLIEASAGTGKTYAITSLYVRLLVEQGLLPENILVVTFTEAATKELRDRIRQRIRDARDAFAGFPTTDTLFLGLLQAAAGDSGPTAAEALVRLEAALQTFDCAAIATIHGFCNRALQENAFESGSLYDTELTPLQTPLVKGLVDDFWRRTFFGTEAELLSLAAVYNWTPESLTGFLKGKLGNPELEIVPQFTAAEIGASEAACQGAFAAASGIWRSRQEEIRSLMTDHDGLRRSDKTYRHDVLEVLLEELTAYLSGDNPYQIFAGFEKFTAGFIAGQRQKKKEPPTDPFFDCCQTLADSLDQRRLAFLWSLYTFVSDRLPRKKAEQNLRFYDDLLTDLLSALQGESGALLAARIRGKFRAALIDEFQDTDQVQYRIFRAIFADDRMPLFLIGDPKQAIYSFRGADIFAYLAAKDDIPAARHFTMDKNWRSTPQLVAAVNLLFSRQPRRPLLFAKLDYPQVTAAHQEQPLLLAGHDAAPLQLWFMGREADSSKPLDLGRARTRIVTTVGREIAALLADGANGSATIGPGPVEPGDIAVIVRSHGEAGLIHEELVSRGIPAVVRSSASIFATDEAVELCTLLAALAEPNHEGKVRAALTTALLGVSGNEIARLLEEEDATEWEQHLAGFRDYHDLWQSHGFTTMFRRLLTREGVRGRLLALPNGERRLTNLLHCSELLHAEESSARLGIDPLYTWFCNQVASPPEGDEHQIRLESDEKAVRILTIHVSKGLEFPIVFCPFSWGGVFANDETVVCHDGGRMTADFGSPDLARHRQLAREESLAENLRLLYVALTRAQYRCYLVWGRFRHSESAALAYLLHGPQGDEPADLLDYLAEELKDVSDAALLAPLQALAGEARGALALTVNPEVSGAMVVPAATTLPALHCRTLDRRIETGWKVSSFSSFAEGHHETAELPDRDERRTGEPGAVVIPPVESSIFAFPRGARAGTFIHEIFEKLDFAATAAAAVATLVHDALGRSSFSGKWREPLTAMVQQAITVPLGRGDHCFRLADLAPHSWLTEMEFFFPLKFITAKQLTAVLQQHAGSAPADLGRVATLLNFREVRGMVRGFVDLVFTHNGKYYLLDWKSNHLGNRVEDYGQEQLSKAMSGNLYPLQYLLYTVALNRYLQLRDPAYCYEDHFGGVFYLFLRGIDAAQPQFGVFHDVPVAALVQELTACLIDCEGA